MNLMAIAGQFRSRSSMTLSLALGLLLVEFGTFALFDDMLRPFPTLLPVTVVTVVAFLGGTRPAALAAIGSEILMQYYVVGPERSFAVPWPAGYIGICFFLFLCAIIITLTHGMFGALGAEQAAQNSLQKLNEGLEERVARRTSQLRSARDDLRKTNQNLEKLVEARVGDLRVANEEIQRFAYIVTHDLRAPLVNVLGFTGELDALAAQLTMFLGRVSAGAPQLATPDVRAAIEEDLPEALAFIRTSTQKMDRLINAILKLSRDGKRKLAPETIDMDAFVRAQGESLAQQLSARHAVLRIEGHLPSLTSDRLAIDQVFGNLIENAVKYLSPARPGEVVVSGAVEEPFLRYDIADNGRGIDGRDFERVFELFRRSGEQDTVGEGIGLAYVRNLTRRLGGNVSLKSELGVGSIFTVWLPTKFLGQEQDVSETQRILI